MSSSPLLAALVRGSQITATRRQIVLLMLLMQWWYLLMRSSPSNSTSTRCPSTTTCTISAAKVSPARRDGSLHTMPPSWLLPQDQVHSSAQGAVPAHPVRDTLASHLLPPRAAQPQPASHGLAIVALHHEHKLPHPFQHGGAADAQDVLPQQRRYQKRRQHAAR